MERQAVVENTAWLLGIVEAAMDAIITVDASQRIVLFNPAAERMFGCPAEEAIGSPVDFLIPGRYRSAHWRYVEQFAAGAAGARVMGQARALFGLRRDGTEFPIEASISKVDVGRQRFLTVVVRDISERVRDEARLRLHSTMLEHSLNGFHILDDQGIVVYANRAYLDMWGYERPEEVVGASQAPHYADPGALPQILAKLKAAGEDRRELTARRRDGSRFEVFMASQLFLAEDGRALCAGTCLDITARKQAEARLRESQQRLAGIVGSAMDAIITIDAEQRVVLFNRAAEILFGCPAQEALGASVERFIPERFRPSHAEHVRHFGETSTTSRTMGNLGQVWGLRSDGSEFPIEASISQVEVGGQKMFTVILRDISERVRAEAEIRRLNADLESRVEARTAELGRANEALLKSNQDLQQFAYVAAHDLQTPLRSISGFAQLLEQECQGKLGEKSEMFVHLLVDNTQRMQTLIRDLLSYSQVDTRARPFEPVDCRQVFDEAVGSLANSIADAGAEVSCGDLPVVMGDRTQLGQLLQNLIGNGMKYHGSAPPRVHVSAQAQDGEWLFSVRDNGIGIDSRHRERIFEIFRRLHSPQAYPGTGIGLAICRRVVERHGGRIWVESQPGEGSDFRFTLPRADGVRP